MSKERERKRDRRGGRRRDRSKSPEGENVYNDPDVVEAREIFMKAQKLLMSLPSKQDEQKAEQTPSLKNESVK